MAGTAKSITKGDFFTGIGFPASKSVYAEIIRIVETSLIPSIGNPVFKDFNGDSGRVFAKIFGDSRERLTVIQSLFNVSTIIKG